MWTLFIHLLFLSNAVSNSVLYRMVASVNNDCGKAVVAGLKLSLHLPGGTEENHGDLSQDNRDLPNT